MFFLFCFPFSGTPGQVGYIYLKQILLLDLKIDKAPVPNSHAQCIRTTANEKRMLKICEDLGKIPAYKKYIYFDEIFLLL